MGTEPNRSDFPRAPLWGAGLDRGVWSHTLKRLLFLVLFLSTPGVSQSKVVVSLLTTCSRLAPNQYPADSTNWFYPDVHPQIVFFAHLLFPVEVQVTPTLTPTSVATVTPSDKSRGPWQPPLKEGLLQAPPVEEASEAMP